MKFLLPVVVSVLLCACGMKGDLYEPPPPARPAGNTEPSDTVSGATEKGERKTIPSTPDPATAK